MRLAPVNHCFIDTADGIQVEIPCLAFKLPDGPTPGVAGNVRQTEYALRAPAGQRFTLGPRAKFGACRHSRTHQDRARTCWRRKIDDSPENKHPESAGPLVRTDMDRFTLIAAKGQIGRNRTKNHKFRQILARTLSSCRKICQTGPRIKNERRSFSWRS